MTASAARAMSQRNFMSRSIQQCRLALRAPGRLVRQRQRVQIGRRGARIVHPTPQQVAAIYHVDGEPVLFVLVRKIAPDHIVRLQSAQRLESKGKQSPWLEPLMVVVRGVLDMHLK